MLDSNVLVHNRKIHYLKQKNVCCPHCYHKNIIEIGYYLKKSIHMDKWSVDCKINDIYVNTVKKVFQQISSRIDKNFSVYNEDKDFV